MNNIELQQNLIRLGLLDPPADGSWGSLSKSALTDFQRRAGLPPTGEATEETKQKLANCTELPLKLGSDLASKIIKYLAAKKFFVALGSQRYNIVYIEGMNADGSLNSDTPNEWNDLRCVIEVGSDGVPRIVGMWYATTEPGRKYTVNPMNPAGAARIAFGQYKAWSVGLHGSDRHEALVQTSPITVCRDLNKDFKRTGDRADTGIFAVNQHWGYDLTRVDGASAGCLVGQAREGHKQFMKIVKSDKRYQANSGYEFWTAVIAGDELAKS